MAETLTVLSISDPNGTANLLGLTTEELVERRGPRLSMTMDRWCAPWATAERVARCLAPLRASQQLLAGIERREAKRVGGRCTAITTSWAGGKACYRTPEDCAELDEPMAAGTRSCSRVVRAEAVNRHDEIQALRDEVLRLSEILDRAMRELAWAGKASIAAKIGRQLGFSLDTA